MTVHGPINPAVGQEVALRETRAVYARIVAGRFLPVQPSTCHTPSSPRWPGTKKPSSR